MPRYVWLVMKVNSNVRFRVGIKLMNTFLILMNEKRKGWEIVFNAMILDPMNDVGVIGVGRVV